MPTSNPAPRSPELPASGYALFIDGQMKTEFKTRDGALKRAQDLKRRFPRLQIKLYDAESKIKEDIELDS
jgi:hypothetical protein